MEFLYKKEAFLKRVAFFGTEIAEFFVALFAILVHLGAPIATWKCDIFFEDNVANEKLFGQLRRELMWKSVRIICVGG